MKDTCNAYVVFKNKDSVAKALESNNSIFHGNHLRIDSVSESTSGIASTKKVFLLEIYLMHQKRH